MAKTLVRKAGGQLVETELQGQGQNAAPTPAVTPLGMAAAGGTPAQAKMAGTPAQKAPVLREAVAPGQTLQEADRRAAYQQQAQAVDQTAKEKVGRLQALGSYGTKLQGIIAGRLAAATESAQPATAQVTANADVIKQRFPYDPAKQAAVTAAVSQYLTTKSEADLQALATAMGVSTLGDEDIRALTTDKTTALTEAAKQTFKVPALTVGELDVSTLGVDPSQLAADLGVSPEALAAMTPDQLQQSVQNAINREYAKGQGLKAEYKTASPQRRQQILQELRALDASGAAGLETAVADLTDRLDSQETIKLGGQEYNIQDILSDDGMSDLVVKAIRSPEELQVLKDDPATQGLAAWIESSRESLETLIGDISVIAHEFEDTQTEAAEVTSALGLPDSELAQAFGAPTGPLTSEQLAAWKDKLANDPLWQTALEDPDLKTALMENPQLVARWQGLDATQIKGLVELSDTLRTDPDKAEALKALGLTWAADGWIDNPDTAAKATALLESLSRLTQPASALTEALAPLKGKAQYKDYFTPAGIESIVTSMNLLYKAELGTAQEKASLTKLFGVNPDSKFLPPTLMSRDDMKALAKSYYDTVSAASAAEADVGMLDTMIQNGTLKAEDLKLVRKRPETLAQLVDVNAARKKYSRLDSELAKGNLNKTRDLMAAALLGDGATFAQLLKSVERASASPKDPKAKAFLEALRKAGLDANNDGKITPWDFVSTGPESLNDDSQYTPENALAAVKAMVAKMRIADVGDETKDTVLAGKFKPSTIAVPWDPTYYGGKTSPFHNPVDTAVPAAQKKADANIAERATVVEPSATPWVRTGKTRTSVANSGGTGKAGGGVKTTTVEAQETRKATDMNNKTSTEYRWVVVSSKSESGGKPTSGSGHK